MGINYDPNLFHLPFPAKQTLELTLQQWNYSKVITEEIDSNVMGLDAMEAVAYITYLNLPVDERGRPYIVLTDAEGNELLCEDEENVGEDWLKPMVVKAEIVSAGTKGKSNVVSI